MNRKKKKVKINKKMLFKPLKMIKKTVKKFQNRETSSKQKLIQINRKQFWKQKKILKNKRKVLI